MRPIDADALKEFVIEKCSNCTSFIGEESVLSWIDKAPTIEEVDELVQCKYCRHYEDGMVGYCWKIDTEVKDDFFCPYGERKDDINSVKE